MRIREARLLTWLVAICAVGALIFATGASAATVRIGITGSVTMGAPDPGTIAIAAASDLGGANPTGTVTVTLPTTPPGAPTNAFHGDISNGGCVRTQGNQAAVIGRLPVSEQYTVPTGSGPQTIAWAATVIEDNGVAGSSPVDRSRPLMLFDATGANWCSTTPFATIAALLMPIASGDAGFGYTDQLAAFPSNPDTDVAVVDPNGLSVAITDAADPDGLNVAVGAGSGSAELDSCATGSTFVTAGSTVVITCASLMLEVVVGSAEVVLAGGAVVSIPAGGVAEIADTGDGYFTAVNLGPVPITTTVAGVEDTIGPGETAVVSANSPAEQIVDLIDKTLLYLDKPALGPILKGRLQAAAAALVAKKPGLACKTLGLYIVGVQLAPTSAFTAAERADLIGRAQAIRTALAC